MSAWLSLYKNELEVHANSALLALRTLRVFKQLESVALNRPVSGWSYASVRLEPEKLNERLCFPKATAEYIRQHSSQG